MYSLNIFVENLEKIEQINNFTTYKELADYLGVKEGTLKCWKNKSRSPSLKQLDILGDRLNVQSYILIQKNANINSEILVQPNNSRENLIMNLQLYFMNNGRFSWNDKAAAFYGFVSVDTLKSYFRKENYKTPPLKRLDEMAEAIGVPSYKLIKGVK